MSSTKPRVLVLIGSSSDEKKVKPCIDLLQGVGEIALMTRICSAHRTAEDVVAIIRDFDPDITIAAAGMAAHLAGAVAARTPTPVIGLPLKSDSGLGNGMEALLSTVMMPSGFPVATVAIDGAKNAAILALQMLALNNEAIAGFVARMRADMAESVRNSDSEFQKNSRRLGE